MQFGVVPHQKITSTDNLPAKTRRAFLGKGKELFVLRSHEFAATSLRIQSLFFGELPSKILLRLSDVLS